MESKIVELVSEGVSRARAEVIAKGDVDPVDLAEAEAIAELERKVYGLAKEGSLPALQFVLANRAPADWMLPARRTDTETDGGQSALEDAIRGLEDRKGESKG